jgi:acetyl-CoA carboxylase biotin carboxyl carrier protein
MAVNLPLEKHEIQRRGADVDLIRELAALLDETGLTEIEIGEGDQRIRVARVPAPQSTYVAEQPSPAVSGGPVARGEEPAAQDTAVDASHPGAVTSPMVGAVYLGPEPGAPPFVTVGDAVSEGQTLFIVEAMKTMNPIRAPRGGHVVRILVENGAPVEYGEVLLVLE